MDLEMVSDKHLHELERLARELLEALRKAKLKEQPLLDALNQLELETGKARRARFDLANSEHRGY